MIRCGSDCAPIHQENIAMVRFLVLYGKPSDADAFERHYREVHIPLAKQLTGLRRYTISRQMAHVRGGEPFYLAAELDWDSMELLQQAFESPLGKATARDVANLAQWSPDVRSMVYEVEEV
jgi:uncharacterized protein (TIGR02118 family)